LQFTVNEFIFVTLFKANIDNSVKQSNMKKEFTTKMGSPELRASLPHGAITRLAEKYGKSWTWINAIVTGQVLGDELILRDAELIADIYQNANAEISKIY